MREKKPVGRQPRAPGTARDKSWPVKLSDEMIEKLKLRQKRDGVPVATQMFRAVEKDLNEEFDDVEPEFIRPYVPMLGEIPAGPADWVIPGPPEVYVRPPFEVPTGAYALQLKGKSMESAFGISIKDRSFAFFDPNIIRASMIVHVEFSDGEFQHKATLKRYLQRGDGMAEFQPLNKDFKKIIVPNEVFTIRGGFFKAWDGVSGTEDEKAK